MQRRQTGREAVFLVKMAEDYHGYSWNGKSIYLQNKCSFLYCILALQPFPQYVTAIQPGGKENNICQLPRAESRFLAYELSRIETKGGVSLCDPECLTTQLWWLLDHHILSKSSYMCFGQCSWDSAMEVLVISVSILQLAYVSRFGQHYTSFHLLLFNCNRWQG